MIEFHCMSSRKERGLTQRIYLVKLDIEDKCLTFHVLGTSRHVYKVVCAESLAPKCSCPDHRMRKGTCKHIFFVCEKVLQIAPDEWSKTNQIDKIVENVVNRLPNLQVFADDYYTKKYHEHITGEKIVSVSEEPTDFFIRNDECSVCLCEIQTKASKDVMVCSTCKNGIHSLCWDKWSQVNGNNKCVYCRTIVENKKDGFAEVIQSGWGILLQ